MQVSPVFRFNAMYAVERTLLCHIVRYIVIAGSMLLRLLLLLGAAAVATGQVPLVNASVLAASEAGTAMYRVALACAKHHGVTLCLHCMLLIFCLNTRHCLHQSAGSFVQQQPQNKQIEFNDAILDALCIPQIHYLPPADCRHELLEPAPVNRKRQCVDGEGHHHEPDLWECQRLDWQHV